MPNITKNHAITYTTTPCLPPKILHKHFLSYNNFEISLVVFMPNITKNHAITYTTTPFLPAKILHKHFLLFLLGPL